MKKLLREMLLLLPTLVRGGHSQPCTFADNFIWPFSGGSDTVSKMKRKYYTVSLIASLDYIIRPNAIPRDGTLS